MKTVKAVGIRIVRESFMENERLGARSEQCRTRQEEGKLKGQKGHHEEKAERG